MSLPHRKKQQKLFAFLGKVFLLLILFSLFCGLSIGQSLLSPSSKEEKTGPSSDSEVIQETAKIVLPPSNAPFRKKVLAGLALYHNQKYSQAIRILQQSFPKEEDLKADDIQKIQELKKLLLFESYLHTQNYSAIVRLAQDYFKNYSLNALVLFDYNYALQQLDKKPKNTELVTSEILQELQAFDPSRDPVFREMLFKDAIAKKNYYRAIDFLSNSEGNLIPKYYNTFERVISEISEPEVIDEFIERIKNNDLKQDLRLKKVRILFRQKQYRQASDLLNRLREESELNLNPAQKQEIGYLANYLSVKDGGKPLKIGVLLPFSENRLNYFSDQVMKGLLLAFGEVQKSQTPIHLIFADTGGNPETARIQALDLIEEKKVVAIIGPIIKNSSTEVFKVADFYKIPVISLSQTAALGENFDYGYRFNFSARQEAIALADYAIDYLGAKNFAILFPNSSQGVKDSILFSKEIQKKGGNLLSFEKIPSDTRELNPVFRRISGNYRFLSRGDNAQTIDTKAISARSQSIDAIYIPSKYQDLKVLEDFIKAYSLNHAYILTGNRVEQNQLYNLDNRRKVINARSYYDRKPFDRFYNEYWKRYQYSNYYFPPSNYAFYSYMTFKLLTHVINREEAFIPSSIKYGIDRIGTQKIDNIGVNFEKNGDITVPISILADRGNLTYAFGNNDE